MREDTLDSKPEDSKPEDSRGRLPLGGGLPAPPNHPPGIIGGPPGPPIPPRDEKTKKLDLGALIDFVRSRAL